MLGDFCIGGAWRELLTSGACAETSGIFVQVRQRAVVLGVSVLNSGTEGGRFDICWTVWQWADFPTSRHVRENSDLCSFSQARHRAVAFSIF